MARPPRHTLFCDAGSLSDAATLTIGGDEADHAVRSRRLRPGDTVCVTDGRGALVTARIDHTRKSSLELTILDRSVAPRISPALRVFTATPKGQRLDKMIDQLSQAGAASWSPLETSLGVVDPGDRKLDRLHRIAIEAAKQCHRPWVLEIGSSTSLDDGVRTSPAVVIADASGAPYRRTGSAEIALLVGPEGGFTEHELASASSVGGAGVQIASFGPLAMRIETAAVVASGIILHTELSPMRD